MAYKKGDIPDSHNVEEIKLFFKDHDDYTLLEIALKYKLKPTILKKWRAKIGLKSETRESDFLRSYKCKKKDVVIVIDQSIWDNKEWFVDAYSKCGIAKISKMIGRTIRTVQKRFIRYGIKPKQWRESIKSKNPCNTKEWVNEKYNIEKMGIKRMAALANVSIYTIYDWMIDYDIYPRTANKASALKRWYILKNKRIEEIAEYNKIHGTSIQSFKEIAGARSKG